MWQPIRGRGQYVMFAAMFGKDYPVPTLAKPDPRIRYICFSDVPRSQSPWEWHYAPRWFVDTKLTVGYIRRMPHLWFGQARAVWVDSVLTNIAVTTENINEWLTQKPVAAINHGARKSAREEADIVAMMRLDSAERIAAVVRQWAAEGFPDNLGLAATMLVAYDLAHPKVPTFCEYWWENNLRGSRRGQIGFTPALWKAGLNWNPIAVDWTKPNRYFARPPEPPTSTGRFVKTATTDLALSDVPPALAASLPTNYLPERWSDRALRANQLLNAAVLEAGEEMPSSTCYFPRTPVSPLTPPDLRLAHERVKLRPAVVASPCHLEGCGPYHDMNVALDARPDITYRVLVPPSALTPLQRRCCDILSETWGARVLRERSI